MENNRRSGKGPTGRRAAGSKTAVRRTGVGRPAKQVRGKDAEIMRLESKEMKEIRPARTKSEKQFDEERPRRSAAAGKPFKSGKDKLSREKSPGRIEREKTAFGKGFGKSSGTDRPSRGTSSYSKPEQQSDEERPRRSAPADKPFRIAKDKPFREKSTSRSEKDGAFPERSYRKGENPERPSRSGSSIRSARGDFKKPFNDKLPKAPQKSASSSSGEGLIRLNKYIANSGICSRREADELILAGTVMVNGKIVTELGTKVSPSDKVQYDNHTIKSEKLVYVLLNKPKGYITTTDDPFDRKTVMTLVENACKERIYPVGRLDRNTTGLLLLTNDGEMAKKLTHPKHRVKKVYHVELDKPLAKNDMLTIASGVELEDGIAQIDEIAYSSDTASKREIGVELHSGKNRIVRRIFESVGYEVVKLDRVVFAGLTKKDLPRGHWRLLSEQELNYLKMLK
ncbi:MAG: pseudouridine synthase [Bacteroidetes bacterium]|nr:pseudouridine synthase [Bacteroidota bacterium]